MKRNKIIILKEKSCISVSYNPLAKKDILNIRIFGLLPNSRKPQTLSVDYMTKSGLNIRPLHGYGRSAHVSTEKYIALLKDLPRKKILSYYELDEKRILAAINDERPINENRCFLEEKENLEIVLQ